MYIEYHLCTFNWFCFKTYYLSYFNPQVDRTGAKVTIVEQKEKKDYTFEDNILDLCLQCLDRGVVPDPVVPKRNISSKL